MEVPHLTLTQVINTSQDAAGHVSREEVCNVAVHGAEMDDEFAWIHCSYLTVCHILKYKAWVKQMKINLNSKNHYRVLC